MTIGQRSGKSGRTDSRNTGLIRPVKDGRIDSGDTASAVAGPLKQVEFQIAAAYTADLVVGGPTEVRKHDLDGKDFIGG